MTKDMKRDLLKYMLVAGVALLTACSSNDDFLQEKYYGKLFPEGFYGNQDALELANNSLMAELNGVFNKDYDCFTNALNGGDDVMTPYSGHQDHVPNDTYHRHSGNRNTRLGWRNAYNAIYKANGIINNYENARGTLREERLQHFAGQAYFARAYMYYWLVRLFNEVPYVETVRVPDRTIMLSPPEFIYERIVEDLKIAEVWLPDSWASIDQVKHNGAAITKGAAKAVLASVYLNMTGFPLKKTEYYALARDKAKELIDNASVYGYRLLNNYDDLWKVTPKLHDEMILSFVFDGIADYTSRGAAFARPIQFNGWESIAGEINFFRMFPPGERKNATYVTEFPLRNPGNPYDVPLIPWPAGQPMVSWENMLFGHPYINKMWDMEGAEGETKWKVLGADDWMSSRTCQVIRYAEVLLIYAEAQAMADGAPNELAYNCINSIRNRAFAGLNSTGKELQRGLTATAFRDSVFVERGWELCSEYANRFFDLIRLELVEDAHKETPANKFLPGRSPKEFPINSNLKKKDYFLLIPEEDALLNPNLLEQNKQYDYLVN